MTEGTMALLAAGAAVLLGGAAAIGARRRRRGAGRLPPYIAALGALVDGDEEGAIRDFKSAVRADSSNADAYLRLGDLFRRRGEVERAYQLHRELAARSALPASMRARVQEALARDLLDLGRPERAVEAATEAARLGADPTPGLELVVEAMERVENVEGAFRAKRDLLRRQGRLRSGARELADYRANQGHALLEKGDLKQAERVLRDARKIDPSSRRARQVAGMLKERQGDYAGAIELWEGLLAECPQEAPALFQGLERVHFLNGSFGEMERTYHRFLEASPGHGGACFGLARFLQRKGSLDEALEVCRRGLGAHPAAPSLRLLQLLLLIQLGRVAEAEAALNDWITETHGGEQKAPAGPGASAVLPSKEGHP